MGMVIMAIVLPAMLSLSLADAGRANMNVKMEDTEREFLDAQNKARAAVGERPLQWDDRVAAYARSYAQQRKGDCQLKHSQGPYGENIFWGGGNSWRPEDAVSAWIGEDKLFNYHTHSCNGYEECGHYTQIVWKSTQRVGCASVRCLNGDTFITCNYDPPGNYLGQKPY